MGQGKGPPCRPLLSRHSYIALRRVQLHASQPRCNMPLVLLLLLLLLLPHPRGHPSADIVNGLRLAAVALPFLSLGLNSPHPP